MTDQDFETNEEIVQIMLMIRNNKEKPTSHPDVQEMMRFILEKLAGEHVEKLHARQLMIHNLQKVRDEERARK